MLRTIWQRLAQQQPGSASSLWLATQQPVATPSSCCVCSVSSIRGSMQQLALQQQAVLHQHSYSTLVPTEQQQAAEMQHQKGEQGVQPPPFFLSNLSSKIPSRKPAIKRPARHQWHYCSPDYDPMMPKPMQHLPPFAPARAHEKDYRAVMLAGMPKHHRNRYRRMWAKNMAIRDQRWRETWERKLAAVRKEEAKLQRKVERIIRQRSWEAWKADQAAAVAEQSAAAELPAPAAAAAAEHLAAARQ